MMNSDYLSIKEAVNLTNKSQSTIQRLCSSLEGTLHVKRDGGKYLISKNYLLEHFKTTNEETDNKSVNHDYSLNSHDYSMTIQILRDELEAKNQQISDLNERLRESNIINMNFQKQLQLAQKNPASNYQESTEKKSFLQSLKSLFIVNE